MTRMRNKVCTCLLVFLCSICLAQTPFNSYIMNGDVKMKEQFFEMALSYYNKAKAVASTGAESALAEEKIAECVRRMTPPEPKEESDTEGTLARPKSKILFTDQYLETGDRYSFEKKAVVYSDEDAEISLYKLEVHPDCIVILSHEDQETAQELEQLPAGLIIPLRSETNEVRRYGSEKDEAQFIVNKKASKNDFGRYHVVLRKEGNHYLKLYSAAEFRQILQDRQEKPKVAAGQVGEKIEPKAERPVESFPVTFTESWFLNLDADGTRLGDSRRNDTELKANDIRWLMLRARYNCPLGYNHSVRIDIKITKPDGKLLTIPGEGVFKGFSTYTVLETLSGGGIFNFAFGADNPGFFTPGRYSVDLWIGGSCNYSCEVDLK